MLTHEELILRLVLAAVLGAVVGIERERLEWAAGLRTHMLVCLGAALVMIVSAFGFNDVISAYRIVLDPSRIAAQVVSGIGFLGAGTILFLRREVIRGLTTAASLWAMAAVGLAAGSGLYVAAIFTTVLVVVILALIKPLEKRLFRRTLNRNILIQIDRHRASLLQIESAIEAEGCAVGKITLNRGETAEDDQVECTLLRSAPKEAIHGIVAKLQEIDGVRSVTF